MKKLLIVEGPGKIETIYSQLQDPDLTIVATYGHFRELDKDVNNGYGFNFVDFQPHWKVIPEKLNVPKKINELANKCDVIYIAGDPDREGEAISWHVYDILSNANKQKSKRAVFQELLKSDILNGINNSRTIDQNIVNAQIGRVILDKYFGFKSSALVQQKVSAKSAGRVQSMALRLIEEKEREIENYKETKWYVLEPTLTGNIKTINKMKKEQKWEVIKYDDLITAQQKFNSLLPDYTLEFISEPITEFKNPPKPFDTAAALKLTDKLNITTKRLQETILQKMYEKGLTTYPRTDSVKIKPEVVADIKKIITDKFGPNYCIDGEPFFNKKQNKNEQGGHDALRPTDMFKTPEDLKPILDEIDVKAYEVYSILRTRTIAACMKPAVYKKIELIFDNCNEKFLSLSKTLEFDGFQKLFKIEEENEDNVSTFDLNNLKIGDTFKCIDPLNAIKVHSTSKPIRYTEATLVDILKKKDIGRPSTFTQMASINTEKGNVEKTSSANGLNPVASKSGKYLFPNKLGRVLANYVINNLNLVINEKYTKEMEEQLSEIEQGHKKWLDDFIKPFVKTFDPLLNDLLIQDPLVKKKEVIQTTMKCPKCNQGFLVLKESKEGKKFFNCSESKYNVKTRKNSGCDFFAWENNGVPENKPKIENDILCPLCNSPMVLRTGPKSKFYGCSKFPKCKGTKQYP